MSIPRSDASEQLVSVIMATRNSRLFLTQAIESVMASGWDSLELIIVDADSHDQTKEIAGSFPKVKLLEQQGKGLYAAWNQGVRAAKGEFFAFLDSDDYWGKDKLKICMTFLNDHEDVGYVISNMQFFLQPGFSVPPGFKAELLLQPCLGRIPGTLVVRRKALDEVGVFREDLKIAGDVDWFARAKDKAVKMAVLPEVLLYKRVHNSNLSNEAEVGTSELLDVLHASIRRQRVRKH